MHMMQGERRSMNLWVVNMGSRPVKEIWMVPDSEDEVWVGDVAGDDEGQEAGEAEEEEKGGDTQETDDAKEESITAVEVIKSSNSLLSPQPLRIPIPGGVLRPDDGFSVPLTLHTESIGEKQFCLFFSYREVSGLVIIPPLRS